MSGQTWEVVRIVHLASIRTGWKPVAQAHKTRGEGRMNPGRRGSEGWS